MSQAAAEVNACQGKRVTQGSENSEDQLLSAYERVVSVQSWASKISG